MKNVLKIKVIKVIGMIVLLACTCLQTSAGSDSPKDKMETEKVKQLLKLESVNAFYLYPKGPRSHDECPRNLGMTEDSLSSYIAHNFNYPYDLIGDTIESRCTVHLGVDSAGSITDIKSLKLSLDMPELAKETRRVINSLKFSGGPEKYDSVTGQWVPDTTSVIIKFNIVPYPVETIDDKSSIIEDLALLGSYSYYGSNGWGGIPVSWVLQQKLKAITTAQEKKELVLTHPSSVIRFTAFNGLLEEHNPDCAALVKNAVTDNSNIMCWAADCGFSEKLSDAMIMRLFRDKSTYTKADSLEIDSLVLYATNEGASEYRGKLLHRLEPTPERYARVKELSKDRVNADALYLLAQYRRAEDKETIIKALGEYRVGLDKHGARNGKGIGRTNQALECILLWPDKDFIPVLEKLGDYELTRKYHSYQRVYLFYRVIMEYDNDWAYKYLEEYFAKKQAGKVYSHKENFYRAYYLNKHPHERFLPLVKKYAKKPRDWDYYDNK